MKKFAKFMAFIMILSSFSSFSMMSANAEVWTNDSMQVNEINFSDKTESSSWFAGTGIFDATATGQVISCLGGQTGYAYKKIDDEHGLSLAMSGGSAIKYNFDRTFGSDGKAVSNPVTGRIHFSFDLYAIKADNTAQAVLQVNNYDYTWDNLIMDIQPKADKYKLPQNGGYGATKDVEFTSGMWYRVDLNMDAGESATIIDVFVNGKYQSTTKVPAALNSLWLTSRNLNNGASNRFVVDNIRVQKEVPACGYENSIDFNDKEASSSLWADETYSAADAVGGVILRNSDSGASYQAIDADHGVSYAMSGSAAFKYVFNRTFDGAGAAVENATNGKFILSFDMYNKLNGTERGRALIQLNNSTSYYDAGLIANIRYNESKYCSVKGGSFTWDYANYTPEVWHKFDLEFDASADSTTVKLYIDGAYIGTKTYAMSLKSVGIFPDGSNVSCYTAIDNVRVTAMIDSKDLTAKATETTISDEAESFAIRFSGTLERSSVNDDPQVIVTEYNKDTGVTRTVDAYAEFDYTATKLNVYFNEALNDNSELTVVLPAELKGLFKEDIKTKSVIVTTKMNMDYADNFERYSDAQVMTRFGNREFSGTTGYNGGAALTSEYSARTQYTLSEPIVTNNATCDYIISFDMKIPDTTKYVQFYVSYNGDNSAFQWKGTDVFNNWKDVGDFEADKWHHYDFVFDYDTSDDSQARKRLHIYQDGTRINTSFGLWDTLSYVRIAAEENYPVYIDNFHARYRNEVDAKTNLDGVISSSIKEAYLSFDDAVDVATLTNDNIYIEDDNSNEVDFTIISTDFYGMTIAFEDGALEKDKEYTLVIDGVKTTAGEPLADVESDGARVFGFSTNERFKVLSARILNGDTEIAKISDWDSSVSYDVELTLDSTRTAEQTIYAVVAGYNAEGLVAVDAVPVKVTTSDVYTKNIAALNMQGANLIKVFVLDGFETLAPLMDNPTKINN